MRLIAMWVSLTTLWAGAAPASVKDLDPKAAAQLVNQNAKNPKFLILDVRTPGEFVDGHIKGAVLLDFKAADFREKLAKLSRKKTYLVHCAVGGRSAKAVRAMADLGFQDVYHLKSGFDGWVDAGLPVVK